MPSTKTNVSRSRDYIITMRHHEVHVHTALERFVWPHVTVPLCNRDGDEVRGKGFPVKTGFAEETSHTIVIPAGLWSTVRNACVRRVGFTEVNESTWPQLEHLTERPHKLLGERDRLILRNLLSAPRGHVAIPAGERHLLFVKSLISSMRHVRWALVYDDIEGSLAIADGMAKSVGASVQCLHSEQFVHLQALDFDGILFFNARNAISDRMIACLQELPAAVRYIVHGAGKYRFTRVIGDTFLDFGFVVNALFGLPATSRPRSMVNSAGVVCKDRDAHKLLKSVLARKASLDDLEGR